MACGSMSQAMIELLETSSMHWITLPPSAEDAVGTQTYLSGMATNIANAKVANSTYLSQAQPFVRKKHKITLILDTARNL